jgi:hypothetical protein
MIMLMPLFLTMLLVGCGCFMQVQKGEAPPPKPPEAQEMVVPEAKQVVPMPPPPPPPLSAPPYIVLPSPPILLSPREYLIRGARDGERYGLYSYVLLSTKPDPKDKKGFDRCLALHEAYVSVLQVYTDVGVSRELRVPKENQNVTYWPLDVTSYSKIGNKGEWFVTHYDSKDASLILAKLSKVLSAQNPGPFIVSTRFPLTSKTGSVKKGEAVVLDLSRIGQTHFTDAFLIFREQITKDPDHWNPTFDYGISRAKCVTVLEDQGRPTIEAVKVVKKLLLPGNAMAGEK